MSAVGCHVAAVLRVSPAWQIHLSGAAYRLFGSGFGPPSIATTSDAVWAAGPEGGVTFIPLRAKEIWLGASAEAHLDVLRPHFEILQHGSVFRVPLFSGAAFLRVGHLFE